MSKHYGKCALCKKESELTFEHIPPRAAFNSSPAKPISGDKMLQDDDRMPWNLEGLQYSNQQRGMGRFSLCKECNNNTGTWYGDAYRVIARIVNCALKQGVTADTKGIGIKDVYPLQFIKQVLSMFCSINNYDDSRMDNLRRFVSDKKKTGIDKTKYRICMYFTQSNLMKYAPLSVVLRATNNGYESMALSEITSYPFGFILYFDPVETWSYDGIDITDFANCQYIDKADIEIQLCIKEMNDYFPTFYRSKEEIMECIEQNKAKKDRS